MFFIGLGTAGPVVTKKHSVNVTVLTCKCVSYLEQPLSRRDCCPWGTMPVALYETQYYYTFTWSYWFAGCFVSEIRKQWLKVDVSSSRTGVDLFAITHSFLPFVAPPSLCNLSCPQWQLVPAAPHCRVSSWDPPNEYILSQPRLGWNRSQDTVVNGCDAQSCCRMGLTEKRTNPELHRAGQPLPWCALGGACDWRTCWATS